LTGSFEIRFSEGMTLDEQLTVLSSELSGNFFLSFTYKGNNTWLIEIKPSTLKNFTAVEYRKIMDIAFKVDESVNTGIYEVEIMNIDFVLNNDTPIKEDLIKVIINVERNVTSIEDVNKIWIFAYTIDNMLKIESSHAELITIYSVTGVQLYSATKKEGLIEIPLVSLPGSVYIIKGSISGTVKVMK